VTLLARSIALNGIYPSARPFTRAVAGYVPASLLPPPGLYPTRQISLAVQKFIEVTADGYTFRLRKRHIKFVL
jgi:hypothetical protein